MRKNLYKKLPIIFLAAALLNANAASAFTFKNPFKKKVKNDSEIKLIQDLKPVVLKDKMEAKETFSIEKCVEYAIEHDPNIKVSAHNLEMQKSKVGQAKSNYFPTLTGGTGYNWQYSNSQGFVSNSNWMGGSKSNSSGYYQLNLSVNQLIWDFGKTFANINMQKYNRESAGYDLDWAILKRIYEVRVAYFSTLAALANVDIYERSVRINTLNFERTNAMFEEGLKSRIDVVNAEVYLTDAKTQLIDAQYQYENAMVTLKNAMYYNEKAPFLVENTENFDFLRNNYKMQTIEIGNMKLNGEDDDYEKSVVLLTSGIQKQDILQNYKFAPYIITLDEAIISAKENRADLKSLKMVVRAQEESLKNVRRTWAPQLSASAGYNLRNMDSTTQTGFSAGANLNLPTVNVMNIKYKIDEGKSYLNIAKENVDLSEKNIGFEVEKNYISMRKYEKIIPLKTDKVRQTLENFELADGRYAVGLNNFIELQDAQTNYNSAQLAFVQAIFDYNVAREQFKKSMGVR